MKKILLILLSAVLIVNISFGQRRTSTVKWFSIAAKGGAGNSLFLNSRLNSDAKVSLDYFSLSTSFGGRFTFTYGDHLGFGSDLLFSTYKQDYSILADSNTYDKTLTLTTMDIVPFFRFTAATGVYVELGAKISTINSVSETNSDATLPFVARDRDLNTYFEPKFNSAMFGFGMAVFKTDRIDINIGVRGTYSFNDILPDRTFNIVNDGVYIPDYDMMDKSTNPLAIQAILEVNYYFAFWGDASCGRGRFMLFQ